MSGAEQSQGQGWWLASDGKWYPPEQYTGIVDEAVVDTTTPAVSTPTVSTSTVSATVASPADNKGMSKGTSVLVGLAVILLLGVAVVGGARMLTSGGSGSEWGSGFKSSFVSGCVSDVGDKKGCQCAADDLEHAGVTEEDLMKAGAIGSPLMLVQSEAGSKVLDSIVECGLQTDSSSTSGSSSQANTGFTFDD